MWTYKDKQSFPPVIRRDRGEGTEYYRGWRAALQKLAAEVLPDKPIKLALKNLLNRLTGLAPVFESEPESSHV